MHTSGLDLRLFVVRNTVVRCVLPIPQQRFSEGRVRLELVRFSASRMGWQCSVNNETGTGGLGHLVGVAVCVVWLPKEV